MDYWFAPDPGPDHHDATTMMAAVCQYDWYSSARADDLCCEYESFLFDMSLDPHERTNLWLSDDHQDVRAAMIARAEELVTLPQNNYGDIVYEFYRQPPHDAEKAFVAAGDYVSPWGCRTIK